MKLFTLERRQSFPITIEEAWEFFSAPQNLSKITPPDMEFIISENHLPKKMYSGQVISYKVKPLAGISLNWVTEITHVKEPFYFVDEQRFGPYKFWHHKHFLESVPEGVLSHDLVHYALPFGPLGTLANQLFVKQKLNSIFNYRYKQLEKMLGVIGS